MYLIDTHTHIFSEEFDSDRDDAIQRALDSGVEKLLLPNIDLDSIAPLHQLCDQHPQTCFPMMGLHPTSVSSNYIEDLEKIRNCFLDRKYIAVGEIGIDLYWDKTFVQEQIAVFEEQLRWSIEWDLPVSIHVRKAYAQVFESLNRVGVDKLRGVFHCFGGSEDELKKALTYKNFMFGINGVVTYPKVNFRDYLTLAPIERIILETDAPYLTPVPYRGKRNEPAYIVNVAEKLAEIYNLSYTTVAEKTTENARRLFNIA